MPYVLSMADSEILTESTSLRLASFFIYCSTLATFNAHQLSKSLREKLETREELTHPQLCKLVFSLPDTTCKGTEFVAPAKFSPQNYDFFNIIFLTDVRRYGWLATHMPSEFV